MADLKALREEVCWVNQMLPKTGLVTMHSGNASGYDPESGRLVIKPSGMDYDKLTPENLVEVILETGEVVGSTLRPVSIWRITCSFTEHIKDVRGVIHTHSNYATAFAAVGKPVPLCLTAIADEFGDEIPCMPYTDNEGEHIGEAILKHMNRSPAMILGNHGVFAWGASPKAALKAAVMVEDVAKTVHLAMQIGTPKPIPPEEAERSLDRYHNRYGQG